MTDYFPWTDEELDALAQVAPEEIEAAKAAYRLHADRKYKLLLDARPYEPEQLPVVEPVTAETEAGENERQENNPPAA